MEDRVCLEGYTASLCCGSCKKERPEIKIVRNVFLNKIEITCGIHESLYFLPHKNQHESLSASKVFVFYLTMTQTRLIHHGNLCSSCIGPGPFALLSIARLLPTLRLFVAFSFTIRAKNLFPAAVFMRRAGNKSINSLKLSRSRTVGRRRVGRDGLGSRSRLGQSFFARATRSCLVSGMLDCLRIFLCISLSNLAKKSITSMLAGSLASSPICVLRVLNRRKNVSSDSLDAFLACTQSSPEVWTRWA